jgi:membrane protein YdbS with pleckstrin-like domain
LAQAAGQDGLEDAGPLGGDLGDLSVVPTEAMVRQESMLINEARLILAEKRTALSVMRTGLAILVLPLSVASVLIAISRYYDPGRVLFLLAPLLAINLLLAVFGIYLIPRSWRRTRTLEAVSQDLKRRNAQLSRPRESVERSRRPL